ncbi:entericidin EcnA/B family protein [Cypionkella sp. TWP1-2-1b2]
MRKMMMMLVLTALTGCGTVDGMGRDVSAGAQRVGGWFN